MSESHQNVARIEATVPAVAAAVAQDQVIDRSPITGQVKSVKVIPEATVVAAAVNFRTIRVVNRGQDGAGATVVASHALDTAGTDNLVAFDERELPITSPNVNAGDVLVVDETVAGTGLAHSGYRIAVLIER